MRRAKWTALMGVICLVPVTARAQPPAQQQRVERRIAVLMEELRTEMWAYRQELDFFQRTPEYPTLVDLRFKLRDQAIRVADLERARGPEARVAQRELAREMEQSARELKRLTGRLENRADLGAPKEVRRLADRLKDHANAIQGTIRRLDNQVR